ncbi:MAG: winged helix-turn-helix transcriptional regulator [Veillonellaceae bacterium]|jgi:GntR family transcriptional regulator|nr:winged helix-turn-helix transcriptional regulator [Veillonellaceae bacterium]
MILQRFGMPIYLQVKNYILEKIKAGDYKPGSKLPTERDLSAELGISRNTVSAAYKELLMEGVLEARQGRGTFVKAVADDDFQIDAAGSKRERLLRLIDNAMAKAQELGFSFEQFAAIVRIRAQEKAVAVRSMRIAVVACAPEHVHHYVSQIGQTVNVSFEEISLLELRTGKVPAELLVACDLVVTAVEHKSEVADLMGGDKTKLITVAAVPNLEAVIKLARLVVGTTVGVVAVSSHYFELFESLLSKNMISGLNLQVCYSDDPEQLRKFIAQQSVIVVADERQNAVRRYAQEGQDIIPFYYEIDQGSLNQLLARLITPV